MAETKPTDIHATTTGGHIERVTPRGRYLAVLSLAALGVVYGDIGTSPLYALRECFHGPHSIVASPANILGVLSLIFWSLVIVISVKYLAFVLHADNHGEGGILSLTALATPIKPSGKSERWVLIVMGIFGSALLYGDGVITPAISILGAMEGLTVATPFFSPYVVPITIVIIVALFFLQSRGTAGIGKIFGPVTLVWFAIAGRARNSTDRSLPGSAYRPQPSSRAGFLSPQRLARVSDSRIGLSCCHRRRGALRRYGPLWDEANPYRLVHCRAAGTSPKLFRSGCAAPRKPGCRREPFLPPGTFVGTLPDGHPGDSCGGDRLASCNHRSVLTQHAGGTTGFQPAFENHAHIDQRVWANIHPNC